jgi:oligoendopeptidase F
MAKSAARSRNLGTLPEWDLADLYPGPSSPEIEADLARMAMAAAAFRDAHRGKIAGLDGAALGAAIAAYEGIEETLSRLSSYAGLLHSGDVSNAEIGRFYQTVQERVNAVSSELIFFTLEINKIEDDALAARLADPALARYTPWLRDVRAYREHELDEPLERLLHEKHVSGRGAWVRLFDETEAALRFSVNGKELTVAETLHLMSEPDATKRKAAAKALGAVFGRNLRLFAHITNTLAKDKEIEDRWRRFPRPQSARNLGNLVEDPVVDALVAAVRDAYPRLSHRYYAMKARWFGRDALDYWDRNAPLPEGEDRLVPWDRARDIVLGAYAGFAPEMAEIGRRFFENAWIDAPVRPGKASGAFAHPTVPSAHPYLLLNYQGRVRDVMTLAHELGHGVHQMLAAPRGQLMSQTPLTLAETASVFGEMLTFRALLAAEKNPAQRKVMLASKVEDMINTVIRQIAFYNFESEVHERRRKGELTADDICDIWLDIQAESLGPAIRFDGEYRTFWTYIPHFIHSPFYVYAYAFGDCLVNSLYALYAEAHEGFAQKYLDMLRAGGTLRHKELLAPFGLDASDPVFWSRGLSVIDGLIDELERLG